MWNADRYCFDCFDADPDPDLDQHLKGNLDSGLDPDKYQTMSIHKTGCASVDRSLHGIPGQDSNPGTPSSSPAQ
jgi:hypothetical protein